jgi:uncharacterized cupin superfamily protein
MQRINIADPDFTFTEDDPERFRSGLFRFGRLIGMTKLGASVYDLPPGQSICPYHYEYGEEEALIVLEGTPTLRHPGGSDVLAPWDAVAFPEGPDGAHAVTNDTDSTVRVLMFSTIALPGATVYPDSDKVGIWTGNEDDTVMVHRSSKVEYFHGEPGV